MGSIDWKANERNRTADLLITNQLLYQLSYVGKKCSPTRISHELSATAPDPSARVAFYGAFSGAFLAPIAPGA